MDEKRKEFEEMVEQESQSQGRDLELQDSQVRINMPVIFMEAQNNVPVHNPEKI